jgi:hypothetical protein
MPIMSAAANSTSSDALFMRLLLLCLCGSNDSLRRLAHHSKRKLQLIQGLIYCGFSELQQQARQNAELAAPACSWRG